MEDDHSIADLLSTVASQYRKQIQNGDVPINKTRLDVIRKLELIVQSIRGLMKYEQGDLTGRRPAMALPDHATPLDETRDQ